MSEMKKEGKYKSSCTKSKTKGIYKCKYKRTGIKKKIDVDNMVKYDEKRKISKMSYQFKELFSQLGLSTSEFFPSKSYY